MRAKQSVGEYVLDAVLGTGATGTVWRAHPEGQPRRTVAVKRLRPAASAGGDLTDLRAEADILAELDNLHIVRILDVVDDEDGLALVMQYAAGGSLADLLARRGQLAPGEVVAVAAPIAEALASAHGRGLVHGDVKPANILFTSDGQPMLADFGVARSMSGAPSSRLVAGTAEYLAPELLTEARPDPRADIYGLAVVCYRALTGRPPYVGADPDEVAAAAERGDHEPLTSVTGVPATLANVVEKAMHRDPAGRFARAQDLAWALRNAVRHRETRLPGPAIAPEGEPADGDGETRMFGPRPPKPDKPRIVRQVPWRQVAVGGAALAVVFVAVLAVTAFVGGESDSPSAGDECPDAPPPSAPDDATTLAGDTDGDGTPDEGYWFIDQRCAPPLIVVVETAAGQPPRRFAIGDAADVPVLGDWNCDGVDTLALYKPSVGQLHYYDQWPGSGSLDAPAETGHPTNATPTVVPEGECDTLVLEAPT
ncbi:MAG: serine/threonine-protein kinase [Acidimicrobiales bacterium]